MSLDVYLTTGERQPRERSGIFIRENGRMREISRAEWDEKCPGHEPTIYESVDQDHEVYSGNITHNLGAMARAAGIYSHLWQPEEIGIERAQQLIEPLRGALKAMRANPEAFRVHDAPNGWGKYEGFVAFVEEYLSACVDHPSAKVYASR